jgi:glycosyltransferase involved in cell wall biosynthesis
MNILFYLLHPEPVHRTVSSVLEYFGRDHPEDRCHVVCREESGLAGLRRFPNFHVIFVEDGLHREWSRFWFAVTTLAPLARKVHADVIWGVNLGLYHRIEIPQVLSVLSAYVTSPWLVTRYHPRGRLGATVFRFFALRSVANASGVLVETPFIARQVRQIKGSPKEIGVILKAVETDNELESQSLTGVMEKRLGAISHQKRFTFLFVAHGYPHKNHVLILSAMQLLKERKVNARLVVTISESQAIAIAPSVARGLLETGHLVAMGTVEKQYLRALYDAADACVMPSVLESLSSSHTEAMEWGKPQVSADLEFARDLCGEAALYASPNDITDFAAKMQLLINDGSLRDRLVAKGHEVMKQFPRSFQEVAEQTHQFLKHVVEIAY